MNVAVIGGGAAGFFSAIAVRQNHPGARVVIFEKSKRLLAKVGISGGGRCNVTNGCASLEALLAAYPRGGRALKKAFGVFDNIDAMRWFTSRGVALVVQEDGCVFPATQNAQTIVDCFLREARRCAVHIETGRAVTGIDPIDGRLALVVADESTPRVFDRVIAATGGCPRRSRLTWLEKLGHRIEDPVPSLFTFHLPAEPVTRLMGIVVPRTLVSLQGTRLSAEGPLLITHWGMSGPAILTLSSRGARVMSENGYVFRIQVNWTAVQNHDAVAERLKRLADMHSRKRLSNASAYDLPQRLWQYLLDKGRLPAAKNWGELSRKEINKLVSVLTNDVYRVDGKAPFREEFVTCGGVSLSSVDMATMQSRVCPNLYFAGELLDIDGITGGFNFQAAWTTAFIAGKLG